MSLTRTWLTGSSGLGVLPLLVAVALITPVTAVSMLPASATSSRPAVKYGKRPLIFERNQGQAHPRVKYLARGLGYSIFLTFDAAVLKLCSRDPITSCAMVQARLLGASRNASIEGEDRLPGTSNYLIGNYESEWHSGIAQFAKVRYTEVYTGIDLVYYGNQRQLEYDFVVSPGADPDTIRLAYSGADRLSLDPHGNLHIHTRRGELVQRKPYLYQVTDGNKELVEGRFKLTGNLSNTEVAFEVGPYDQNRSLIIDPVLAYSSYLGGSDFDLAKGIAVDDDGNVYVTGTTVSIDFPTTAPLQTASAGGADAFVTKLDSRGRVVYSTYLGGSNADDVSAVSVDNSGNAYIVGETRSTDFPIASALQSDNAGGVDTFLAKVDATGGTLVYSTYLGGSDDDVALDIAVDAGDNPYVVGQTQSPDFHTTVNALQAIPPEPERGCFEGRESAEENGRTNAFAIKLNAGGGMLLYATYLGGSNFDTASSVAVNSAGDAYVVGTTCSTDFPTVDPLQRDNAGGSLAQDVFVSKLDSAGSGLLYSTYLGGSRPDGAVAVAVDASGNAYVAGFTNSCDFPTANALQAAIGDCVLGSDGFVAKFDGSDDRLIYSTYLGGTAGDSISAIAVDASGNAYVAGTTNSTDFPTVNPIQASHADGGELSDIFISQIDARGSAIVYSTYLGGGRIDDKPSIAVDSSGNAYITGNTNSDDFPTIDPFQGTKGGLTDAFIAKVAPAQNGGEGEESSGGGGGGGSFGWFLLSGLFMMAAASRSRVDSTDQGVASSLHPGIRLPP